MKGACAGALVLLLACNPGPPAPGAKLWTVRDFEKPRGKPFGGFWPDELMTKQGAQLPYDGGVQVGGNGLTLFPAISGGKAAAFVITDIWQNHPDPWVQPVWIPLDANTNTKPAGVSNVFPVDVESSFYSPFWRAEFVFTPGLTADTYRSGKDVLEARVERRSGAVILCPLAPANTTFANDGTGLKEPITRRPITTFPTELSFAWVDERQVSYLDFGPDRAQADAQNLVEQPAYFFVKARGERPLPLVAVLVADAHRHGLVRRVDVVLPSKAGAFVPRNRPDLRAVLEARELTVPEVNPALDLFPQYALRVAADAECFKDLAHFPASCTWLDSPAALEALSADHLIVQPVQLAIAAVVLP